MNKQKILLAGQQNAGKSTIFNMLSGARQHVANYPGVTVDKKTGYFSNKNGSYQLIDLPGTYSLTSFSLEERVARRALREEHADVILNIIDAANIHRSLHLTLQLMELELPVAIALNMMDVAESEGLSIDSAKLAKELNTPVIKCIGRQGKGVSEISDAVTHVTNSNFTIPHPKLEGSITAISALLKKMELKEAPALRWLSMRLLEQDREAIVWLSEAIDERCFELLQNTISDEREKIADMLTVGINDYVIAQRQLVVKALLSTCVQFTHRDTDEKTLTQKLDRIVLSKLGAPICLICTIFIIYQCAIVYGYELTNYWWPYLASMRELIAGLLPEAGFLYDPYARSLGLWLVDSANTLLNYIPIFLILFAMIAILEDSGYMARIAFICDKMLSKFGLHGQSTLPMILAGVFAGGCAVPGIMATKGIPDNRARLATILTVPYMNCLAKVPLYTLLLGLFFVENKSLMTFYISTISIIAALLVAKLLTKTVLRRTETAPFIMELPRYNLPTVRSVVTRSLERTWMYVRKVGTIVLAVSTVIFVLLQFPGVPEPERLEFQAQAERAVVTFEKKIAKTSYAGKFDDTSLPELVNFYTDYKRAKLNASGAAGSKKVNQTFTNRNAAFFTIVRPAKGDKEAKTVNKALRKLASTRKMLRRQMKERRLEASLLGSFGRSIEPVTKYAGFDWKVNIALFSSFVARESSVATLSVLFQQDEDSNKKLEERMADSNELAAHGEVMAVALILFFILYPPCLATVMMIKVQTGKYKWMLLSIVLPTLIGFTVSTIVYTLGTKFNMSGIELMTLTYFSGLILLLLLGLKDWIRLKMLPAEILIKNIT
ncbi:ferrous iron transport protein B [Vibrio sp. YMD68]|uniref:ferrous iron transport protein B n=1 Tax=Vibrio sp. YMD68 TaxID=3042300 RepID=UPI00249BF5CA|nr:ferrous iron transport protein B [Vibrio sp. YMD68]WGV98862.1 ferrous iron transport protein B [Vibrio sp. YMD68]